jgi:hypothetical protein
MHFIYHVNSMKNLGLLLVLTYPYMHVSRLDFFYSDTCYYFDIDNQHVLDESYFGCAL